MEMSRTNFDVVESRLVNFAHDRRDARDRIAQLKTLIDAAQKSGGILTMSLEALQDGILNIPVGPDVLLPHLAMELAKEEARLELMDAKAKQLWGIFNSKEAA
jgi:cell division septum initiation protein DivIVA